MSHLHVELLFNFFFIFTEPTIIPPLSKRATHFVLYLGGDAPPIVEDPVDAIDGEDDGGAHQDVHVAAAEEEAEAPAAAAVIDFYQRRRRRGSGNSHQNSQWWVEDFSR